MIVHLAQVVGEMRREVREKRSGRGVDAADLFGKGTGEVCLGDLAHAVFDRGDGVVDLAQQLGARHVLVAEFRIAIADIPVLAEHVAEEVLEITGEMEREVAARIGDARRPLPEMASGGYEFVFPPSAVSLRGVNNGDPFFNKILPRRWRPAQRPNSVCEGSTRRTSAQNRGRSNQCTACAAVTRSTDASSRPLTSAGPTR